MFGSACFMSLMCLGIKIIGLLTTDNFQTGAQRSYNIKRRIQHFSCRNKSKLLHKALSVKLRLNKAQGFDLISPELIYTWQRAKKSF